MKTLLLYLIVIVIFSCCGQNPKQEKHLSPISSWLKDNEDSLVKQLKIFIASQNLEEGNESILMSKEWVIDDSTILGSFTKKIKSLDSNIIFSYQFEPNDIRKYSLHLSPDRKLTAAISIDSIFNDLDSLKLFNIRKYNPPVRTFSKYIIENKNGKKIVIDPDEIGFKLTSTGPKYKLYCFLNPEVPKELKEDLLYNLLGDETIIKKIDTVVYLNNSITDSSKLSIREIQEKLNVNF